MIRETPGGKARQEQVNYAFYVSLCGIMTGLNIAVMLLFQTNNFTRIISNMLPFAIMILISAEFGSKRAVPVWIATALLGFILAPIKKDSFLFLMIGWYPIVKPYLDRIVFPYRIAVKIILCSATAIVTAFISVLLILKGFFVGVNIEGLGIGIVSFAHVAVPLLLMLYMDMMYKDIQNWSGKNLHPLISKYGCFR